MQKEKCLLIEKQKQYNSLEDVIDNLESINHKLSVRTQSLDDLLKLKSENIIRTEINKYNLGKKMLALRDSKIGDCVKFGLYEQDDYLKPKGKKDIEWIVIDRNQTTVLVISKDNIEYLPYQKESESVFNWNSYCWDKSSIKKWLNNEFLDTSFSDFEKSTIYNVTLLNAEEARRYLSVSQRACKSTPYVISKAKFPPSSWALRDLTANNAWCMAVLTADANPSMVGNIKVGGNVCSPRGIRPVVRINLP